MSSNLFENTDTILSEERIFPPTSEMVANANITAYMKSKGFDDYESFHKWSLSNRFEFWDDMAKELSWFEPWKTTFEWTEKPFFKWFVGGKFNIVYNCLDRHMNTPVRNKVAFHWEADNGETRSITYEQLYKRTNQLAKGLQNLGIKKGDRVAIYMPAILEQVIALLAVARLGAVHTVVFGGFAASALRDRINDAEAKVLITADGNHRRGQVVPLKQNAEEAIRECPSIRHVVTVRRTGGDHPFTAGRDLWYQDLI